MHSQTWQFLPPQMLEPVLLGLVTLLEVTELFDLWLMTPADQQVPIPRRLEKAASLVFSRDLEADLLIH